MSSTNKTSLGLNQWTVFDKPTRQDYNSDNKIVNDKLVSYDSQLAEIAIYLDNYPTIRSENSDDALAIQRAVNACASMGGGTVYANPNRTYNMASTVNIPIKVTFNGRQATFVPSAKGKFKNNYMFTMNSKDASDWDVAFSSTITVISNMRFINTNNVTGVKGIFCAASSAKIKNIYCQKMYGVITRSGEYIDMIEIDTIISSQTHTTDYDIDITFLGDGLKIDCITSDGKGIKVNGCMGGKISRVINGDIYIENSEAVSLENLHMETGTITLKNSQVTIQDFFITRKCGHIEILPSDYGHQPITILKNGAFHYFTDFDNSILDDYDIKLAGIVTLENVFRIQSPQGNIESKTICGCYTDNSKFNDFSAEMSKFCIIDNGDINNQSVFTLSTDILYSLEINDTFTIQPGYSNGTYYFKQSLIVDKARMIGKQSYEVERIGTISTSNTGFRLIVATALNNNMIVRLYRGTTTGSYNYYCDIPYHNSTLLIDSGSDVCGFKWIPRAAREREALNFYDKIKYNGGNVECYGSAIPTVGTWRKYDRIINNSFTKGQPKAWVCTMSGTQGTLNSSNTTGSITSGTAILNVNSNAGMVVGQYITIKGVTETKVITAISGTALTIDSKADTTVTNAVISFFNAIFISEGNL